MRKFIFNGAIISAAIGLWTTIQTTKSGPRDWRVPLMWISAALSLVILGTASLSLGQRITIGGNTGGMQAPLVTADRLVANKSIVLNDADGKPRLVFSNDKDDPAIAVKDADDHNLFAVSLDKDGANLQIKDAKGKKLFSAP